MPIFANTQAAMNTFARTGVLYSPNKTALIGPANSIRFPLTVAMINQGKVLFPAIDGGKYRMISFHAIAVGGAAAGATSITIGGQKNGVAVNLVTIPIATLTQSTIVTQSTATVVILADGASFADLDANSVISIGKTGGNLAGATGIDINITVALSLA